MKSKALLLLFFIININIILAQDSNNLQPTSIDLDKTYNVKLQSQQTQTWILNLPNKPNPSTDLFVTVQSPPNDPLQQPLLTISSSGQDLQQCYQANNEFSGVCRLDGSKLKENMTIEIQAKCLVQCDLVIYAQLNQRYVLSLENTLYLRAPQNAAAEFEFQVQVPSDLKFTQIAIFTQITDFLHANEGLELYANVGDQKISIPNETFYNVKGEPIFWGGEGLYFSKQDFDKGRVIKIYLSLSAGMQVKLYSKVTNGNDFVIALGQSYFDYTSPKQPKRYYLDLSNKQKQIEGKTIALGFIVYGGNPNIKVAFDVEFKTTLEGSNNYGTINFIITQSLRKSLGFKGTIFISVSSIWNADYFMSSSLFQKNYLSVQPQISYYNEVLSGEIFNYFFDQTFYYNPAQTNISSNRTFDIKIGLINGAGTFGVRRCKAAEGKGTPLDCVMSSINDLSNQTILQDFYQIPVIVKKTDQFHQMLFDYDLSTCTHLEVNKNTSAYYCFFHIVAAARTGDIKYTLSLLKRKYSSLLKEGQVVRETIFKEQLIYYRFALSSLEDVEEVAIYITLIEGEAELLASKIDSYPDFYSKDPALKTSNSKRIIFTKNELANNIYVSVYGMELSQYTIGVVVKRAKLLPDSNTSNQTKNNKTEISKMKLNLGVTQQFILKVGEEKALFQVSSIKEGKFTIQVVQLVGNVNMSVSKSNGEPVTCSQIQQTSTKISCSLTLKAGENVLATVSGVQGDQQKFVIVYYKSDSCVTYSLNLPFYRELASSKSECISYEITKATDLQLAISASIAQILHGDLLLQICINNGKCKKTANSRHHQLTKSQLQALCDFDKSSVSQACKIVLNFTNNSTQTLYYSLILQQKSVDVALFDGITQTVTSSELSESKAKHFYYQVNSNTTIRIFFTSFTSNVYCVLAHFISERQFINNSTNIYIPYDKRQSYKKNKGNYYQFYKYNAGTTFYPISTETLGSICQNCMLTLSVFKLESINSHSLSIFEVEVSQQETSLVVGQSKIGFVQQDEIFVYQLQQPTFNDAVVTIRDLSKESFTQKDCFKISLTEADSFAYSSMFVVPKNSKKLTLFITTESKVCNFEISYSLSGGSIIQASQGRIYNFQINTKQTAYFIYKHRNEKSFKVVSIINTGQVQIAVTNLQSNKTLKTVLSQNPLNYPLVGDASEGQLMVETNSAVFCSNCSYVIALTSQRGAKGQVLITNLNATIPLSINGLIRQKIKINENTVRNYTFSSITTFNISINIIYGRIRVTVIDPDSKVVKDMIINSSEVIRVRHSKQTENYTFEFDSVYATFKINVAAQIDSSFTVKTSKIAISQRIFEGIISYFQVKKKEPFIMEFLNMNKPANDSATINVLIQVIKVMDNSTVEPIINLDAVYSKRQGNQVVPLPASNRINSQSTINIQFPLKRGDYYLNLTSNVQAVLSVLLVKESLIHLKPESSVMMSKPGIFELYSPFKSVMIEIYSCEGDLSVQATDDYSNFQSQAQKKENDQIVLQQTNYGGHYVVSTTNTFGQYFIKVKNRARQNTSLLYLLNYYYYDQKDVLPYKIIDQGSTSLTYSLNADSIVFTIESVSIKDEYKDQITSVSVQYNLYVDTEKSKVTKYANCRLEKTVRVFNATRTTADSVDFTVNFSELQKSKQAIFFVGAQAIVNLVPSAKKDQHYPRQLNLIYDVIQITNSKLPVMKDHRNGYSAKTIILWILFPFALAGLALFFAIKFCIKKYRGMVPDNFVQEQVGQSEQVVSTKEKEIKTNSNASGTFKQQIQ